MAVVQDSYKLEPTNNKCKYSNKKDILQHYFCPASIEPQTTLNADLKIQLRSANVLLTLD
jgi:hypothetical protein